MAETASTIHSNEDSTQKDEVRERYLAYRRQYYRDNKERILAQNRASAEARKAGRTTSSRASTPPRKPAQKKPGSNERPVKDLSTNYDRDLIFAAIQEELEENRND